MTRPLPDRDGVSASAVFLPPGEWPTVLAFLAERFPGVDADCWQARMAAGRVVGEDGSELAPVAVYRPRTRVFYYRELDDELVIPFEEHVLFEDEHLVIADKPHFLPVAPVGQYLRETLLARLKRRLGIPQLVPLHRLDRETAGLVMLSKNVASRDAYHALFRGDGIEKLYDAVAPLDPALAFPLTRRSRIARAERFYRREEVEGVPNAVSVITLMEAGDRFGRYCLQPVTGKTHQLRVHMAAIGLPIRNDLLYPQERDRAEEDPSRPLQLLARHLAFRDPLTGEERCFESRFRLQPL